MGWTDERIETLTKLWLDGISVTQIAKHFGDINRGAVIGKVHRLGLSGRAAPSQPKHKVVEAPKSAPAKAVTKKVVGVSKTSRPVVEPKVERPEPVAAKQQVISAPPPAEIIPLPERGLATALTLGTRMCKWPIGDPASDEFTFCGRRSGDGGPYCVDHARIAYRPFVPKKKRA
jgi:GcrA cell cycle regulator